jgi:hypothetical protein
LPRLGGKLSRADEKRKGGRENAGGEEERVSTETKELRKAVRENETKRGRNRGQEETEHSKQAETKGGQEKLEDDKLSGQQVSNL